MFALKGSTNPQPLIIKTNNTEQLGVTTSGSVGIGTTTPSALLHVAGTGWFDGVLTADNNLVVNGSATLGDAAADAVTVVAGTVTLQNVPGSSTATDVLVRTAGGTGEYRSASRLVGTTGWLLGGNTLASVQNLGTQSNHDLPIITNNTERMRVTTTGNVGIGTTGPSERLQVSDGNIVITNADNTARQVRLYEPSGSGANFTAFRAQAQASDIIYTPPASAATTSAAWLQSNDTWSDELAPGTLWNGVCGPAKYRCKYEHHFHSNHHRCAKRPI
jgi:hypothetical protein